MSLIESITANQKHQTWKSLALDIIFFLENDLGSKFLRKPIADLHRGKYLNLGCGEDKFDGWVNADLYKFDKIFRGLETWPDWMLDATKPWNCPDNFWSGIYTEHAIEHIKYIGVVALF